MRFDSVIDAIGHTPLVRLSVPGADGVEVYAMLELQTLFAMTDRVAKNAILSAKRSGVLADGAPIIESSSGTMALGLALVGTHLGHPVHIVTDPRIDPITLAKLETLGCQVHVVAAMSGQGWQSARLELLATLLADLPGAFWPRQYSNPDNPASYAALAAELRDEIGDFHILVAAVGSGGSLCGTTKALRPHLPELRAVAVDCAGSVLFAQPDRPQRKQSGLGNSLQPENIDYGLIDEVHWLSDDEAFAATRALAREQKIFGGNTSGSVYRVLSFLAGQAAAGTRLVGILPDRGDRYIDSVYRAAPGEVASAPVEVSYGTPVVSWSFAQIPKRPFIFVESNTTGTGMQALRLAARLGTTPVLLANKPERYRGLADIRCEVVACDTNDDAVLTKAIDEYRAVTGVATTSEFYLVPVAGQAARLGLPGNPPEAMANCRDKSRTRLVLREAGLPQPEFAIVRHIDDVPAAVAAARLPCVVKPADDSSSTNVLLCRSVEEAAAHAAKVLAIESNVRGQATARTVLVEQYLPGPELSVEMFSVAGRATCIGVTAKSVTEGGPYFVEYQHIFPADLPPSMQPEVAQTVAKALTATGFAYGASHVEVKPTEAGCAIVEINARLAGGMIPELVRLATGIDLLEQQLRAFAGLPVLLEPARSRYAGVRFLLASEAGRLVDIDGVAAARAMPHVESVTVTVGVGASVVPARDAYDRLGYVIATGESAEEVRVALAAACERITMTVEANSE
ncbi:MAG: pyridoxal-phosphate dependent enzyme [Micromonosporaceae bacterium]